MDVVASGGKWDDTAMKDAPLSPPGSEQWRMRSVPPER
jgi:hypothetical protein